MKGNKKRADGRVCVAVSLGRDANGKRKYKYCYGATQKEAEAKATAVRASLQKGMDLVSYDTYADLVDIWLATKKVQVSPDQGELLTSRCRIIKKALGDQKVRELKAVDYQNFINALSLRNPNTGKPSAKNTLRAYSQILASVGRMAVKNRIIDFNAAEDLLLPKEAPTHKRRALSEEERQRVLEFKHRAQPAAVLMMLSGLRRGEATALTWNDIDLNRGTIRVERSYNFKQRAFKTPKNGKARTVYIPKQLKDFLREMPHKGIYVITNARGGMMTDTAWKTLFNSYMTDMNLEYSGYKGSKYNPHGVPMLIRPFTPHDLRHTFATILYESGTDVLIAQEQLGHSDVKTTLSIYTHLSAEHQERNLDKLDAYLEGLF